MGFESLTRSQHERSYPARRVYTVHMLKIYIARHGQNEDNATGILNGHRDLPLTQKGQDQAQQLAEGIRKIGLTFDAVYTSPLNRAYDTALVVTDALKLSRPQMMSDLIERDFGVMTGKPIAEIEKLCAPNIIKTDSITYFLSPEGAETFPDLLARGTHVIEEIQALHPNGTVLLVTHGDIGKMIYAAYYDLSWQDVLTMFHFGNSELLLLSSDSKPEDTHVVHIKQPNSARDASI